jgi:hypothetical protein
MVTVQRTQGVQRVDWVANVIIPAGFILTVIIGAALGAVANS